MARVVLHEVPVPAGVMLDVNGEFSALSGGILQVQAQGDTKDEANERVLELADEISAAVRGEAQPK